MMFAVVLFLLVVIQLGFSVWYVTRLRVLFGEVRRMEQHYQDVSSLIRSLSGAPDDGVSDVSAEDILAAQELVSKLGLDRAVSKDC